MARHRVSALVRRHRPVFDSSIGMKDEMLVHRACIADRGFPPMTNQLLCVIRWRGVFLKSNNWRSRCRRATHRDGKSNAVYETKDCVTNCKFSHCNLRASDFEQMATAISSQLRQYVAGVGNETSVRSNQNSKWQSQRSLRSVGLFHLR